MPIKQVVRLSRAEETVLVTVPIDLPDDYKLVSLAQQPHQPWLVGPWWVDFFVSEATNSIFIFYQTRCRGFSPITRQCPCTDCPTDLIRVVVVDRENTQRIRYGNPVEGVLDKVFVLDDLQLVSLTAGDSCGGQNYY